MSEYGDELIAKALNIHKKGLSGNCSEGLYISEELHIFRRFSFYDDLFSFYIPLRLELDHSEEEDNTFDYRFVYQTKGIRLLISRCEEPQKDHVEDYRDFIIEQISHIMPAMKCFETGTNHYDHVDIAWFDTKMSMLGVNLYQYYCYLKFPSDEAIYQVYFETQLHLMQNWSKVIRMMIDTIQTK